MLLVQDFNQLVHHYGKHEADAIKANCFAKMYFTGQSLETSKELEQTLGKYEFKDEKGNKVVRPLMTNDEIRTMQLRHALLICGHHAPIKAWLKPYYKSFIFSKRSNIPAPEITGSCSLDKVPVLPITVPEKAQ